MFFCVLFPKFFLIEQVFYPNLVKFKPLALHCKRRRRAALRVRRVRTRKQASVRQFLVCASGVGKRRCVCAVCARATERASVRLSNLFVLLAASGRVNHTTLTNKQTIERTKERFNEQTNNLNRAPWRVL